MKITIRGYKYDYPYIFVNEVQMPATFIARPANPRVDMGRRIIIEPALPEGGNTLLTADYLDFEINEVVISDNPSAYTPADVLRLLNEGFESPTGDDFPGIGSGLYSGGGGSPEIPDGSITTAKLADGAVSTVKIADGAIIDKKIANYAVGTNAIQNNAINASKIVDRAVGNSKIGLKVINSTNIADGGISTENIADKAITAEKIADATITGTQIAAESITNEEILDYTIDAAIKMVPSSVDESCIATAAVGSRQLQIAAVNTPAIMNKAITPEKLADKISVLLPNTVTNIAHNISGSPINFPEGTIGTLNIPPSPSNEAITVYLVQSPSGLLVHHWTMLVFKNDVGPFRITFSGGSIGTMPFDLPQYAINCILDIYFYPPYGLIVGVAQPNFIVK